MRASGEADFGEFDGEAFEVVVLVVAVQRVVVGFAGGEVGFGGGGEAEEDGGVDAAFLGGDDFDGAGVRAAMSVRRRAMASVSSRSALLRTTMSADMSWSS